MFSFIPSPVPEPMAHQCRDEMPNLTANHSDGHTRFFQVTARPSRLLTAMLHLAPPHPVSIAALTRPTVLGTMLTGVGAAVARTPADPRLFAGPHARDVTRNSSLGGGPRQVLGAQR